MENAADDVARKVADSWELEAEKISAEARASDPEARKKHVLLKVLAHMAREGKIQESFTRVMDVFSAMTPEELDAHMEKFQKEHDIDLTGELGKIIGFVTAAFHGKKPSETAADDLIRSMFTGK
ncbi:MAG: hypothetical protein LBI34_04075 [Puniceicoccales bacterium]|jgi:hypothetical protein|nr:hypothetical protein [Puniceicoccales bacterium]